MKGVGCADHRRRDDEVFDRRYEDNDSPWADDDEGEDGDEQ